MIFGNDDQIRQTKLNTWISVDSLRELLLKCSMNVNFTFNVKTKQTIKRNCSKLATGSLVSQQFPSKTRLLASCTEY